jgi:hypothetical protein
MRQIMEYTGKDTKGEISNAEYTTYVIGRTNQIGLVIRL